MSNVPSTPVPAGWYPDPAGSFQQRWWNGSTWTNDFAQYRPTLVHAAPAVVQQAQLAAATPQHAAVPAIPSYPVAATGAAAMPPQLAPQTLSTQTLERQQPPAFDPLPSFSRPVADQAPRTSVAQPNAAQATLIPSNYAERRIAVPAVNPTFENEYLPFGSTSQVRAGLRDLPTRRGTVAAWILTLMPAFLVGAAFALATFFAPAYTYFAAGGLVVLYVALSAVFAYSDGRVLRSDGHISTASAILAVPLPAVFLIARSVSVARETGRGFAAPVVFSVIVLAAIAAALTLMPQVLNTLMTFASF